MGVSKNNRAPQMALAQHQPDKPPAGQRSQRKQAPGKQRVMRILIAGLRHGGNKFLPGVLLNAHTHLLAQRDVLIPRLLQLSAPVAAMQNVIERGNRFDHQKVADWRSLRRGDFALIDKPQLGEEFDCVFPRATGHSFDPFLTRDGLQRHRHQRSQPLLLHGGIDSHETDGSLIIGIDVQPPDGNQIALFIHHHLVVRHRVPGITLGTLRLMQRLAQHFPAKLIVTL